MSERASHRASVMQDETEKSFLRPESPCMPLPDAYLVKKRLSVHLEKRRGSLTDYVREHASLALSHLLTSPSSSSVSSSSAETTTTTTTDDVYSFRVFDLNDNEVSLEKYRDFVLIIVNVASECGLTQVNYDQLNQLHDQYHDRGLRILAFPCNQFAEQEPGTSQEICEFVQQANVKFDVFQKIDVNGEGGHPLFLYLQSKLPGSITNHIKWNFTKFLINRKGEPVNRFAPTTPPKAMEEDILHLLRK